MSKKETTAGYDIQVWELPDGEHADDISHCAWYLPHKSFVL